MDIKLSSLLRYTRKLSLKSILSARHMLGRFVESDMLSR